MLGDPSNNAGNVANGDWERNYTTQAHNAASTQRLESDPRYQTTAGTDRYLHQVFERLRELPGVESAAYITTLPTELCPDLPFRIEGRAENEFGGSNYKHITPDYFRVFGIP